MAKGRLFFNYFKHVPDDLVITSTPGMVISLLGTILMCTLFVFEVNAYLSVTSSTTLVVDELVDEVLRANFNVTLHQVPCEYLSVDVSDLTGTSRHNITKDILKWRLDSNQRPIGGSMAVTAHAAGEIDEKKHENAGLYFDPDEEPEPADTKYSQHLTEAEFPNFLAKHELTLVNYYAPWCIWCRRLEPVYLDAASHVPDLQFHGHARLAQVDCVDQQQFCAKQMVRAYPTLRMHKDGDPVNFELFTGARTREAIIGFIQQQMDLYKKSHTVHKQDGAAKWAVKHGALSAGSDLYRARLDVVAAQTYCGTNPRCAGFTWQSRLPGAPSTPVKAGEKVSPGVEEAPLVYFKGGISVEQAHASMNTDDAWSSYIKLANATETVSTAGSLNHGPEGCRIAGHLNVRKVPGTLRLALHSTEHDHEAHLINSSHVVHELWFGEPLAKQQRQRLSYADQQELLSPTSHRLDGMPFFSGAAGHSHVHYLKVVTKVLRHYEPRYSGTSDTLVYKYTVHSNKYTVHSNKFSSHPEEGANIEFKYDLSPISIVVEQQRVPMYKFLTSSCAIIGGVFTVIGLLENVIHHGAAAITKKQM